MLGHLSLSSSPAAQTPRQSHSLKDSECAIAPFGLLKYGIWATVRRDRADNLSPHPFCEGTEIGFAQPIGALGVSAAGATGDPDLSRRHGHRHPEAELA
ncbi:MAG: hypothetical protein ACFB8W_19480 [Elainellaceae cyanobacterium]